MTHQTEAVLNAHLRDPSSTAASVGDGIRARFNPKDDAVWLRLRDRVSISPRRVAAGSAEIRAAAVRGCIRGVRA